MKLQDIQEIETKIGELEKLSSIEYVTVFTKKCRTYWELKTFWAAIFGGSTFFALQSVWLSFALQVFITALVFVLTFVSVGRLHFLFRFFTFDSWVNRIVEQTAREEFLNHEVFATQQRTGVLILVAHLEQKVYVLADKGLLKHSTTEEWSELGVKLAKVLADSNNHADTFLAALKEISDKYSNLFPPCPKNSNEIDNKPRIRN